MKKEKEKRIYEAKFHGKLEQSKSCFSLTFFDIENIDVNFLKYIQVPIESCFFPFRVYEKT